MTDQEDDGRTYRKSPMVNREGKGDRFPKIPDRYGGPGADLPVGKQNEEELKYFLKRKPKFDE